MSPQKTVSPFSAGYFILDADTVPYTGENVAVPRDYFGELMNYTTYPLLRVGTEHLWAHSQRGVPANTVALPGDVTSMTENEPVLMAKDETAHRLVKTGEKERPQL